MVKGRDQCWPKIKKKEETNSALFSMYDFASVGVAPIMFYAKIPHMFSKMLLLSTFLLLLNLIKKCTFKDYYVIFE